MPHAVPMHDKYPRTLIKLAPRATPVPRHYTDGRRQSFVFDAPRHARRPRTSIHDEYPPPAHRGSLVSTDTSRFNRGAVPDVYGMFVASSVVRVQEKLRLNAARMMASPIRRCAITGAKLPKGSAISSSCAVPWASQADDLRPRFHDTTASSIRRRSRPPSDRPSPAFRSVHEEIISHTKSHQLRPWRRATKRKSRKIQIHPLPRRNAPDTLPQERWGFRSAREEH